MKSYERDLEQTTNLREQVETRDKQKQLTQFCIGLKTVFL